MISDPSSRNETTSTPATPKTPVYRPARPLDTPAGDPAGGPARRPARGPARRPARGPAGTRARAWLRAYWLSPQGLVTLAATGLALALRLFLLSRPGFLTGPTEYDDGVYLGGAIRLISGALPYHDFGFVQPPGILLLMAPVAVIAKLNVATHAMAAARLLTVAASVACVPLAGALVRYRGAFVTLVTCGLLAVYPDDVTTAHTLILEPWMNLLLLAGVVAAFRRGRLADPRRLLWAGVAIGLAATIKYWAGLPALTLLAVCLLSRSADRKARVRRYALGLAAGFAAPILPFAAASPGVFFRSTVLDQASRAGTWVPASLRLAHLTGLIDFLNAKGALTLKAGTHSLFARDSVAAVQTMGTGWLPLIAAAVPAAALAAGYLARPARPAPLAWYALANCAGAVAAVLSYSAFFYHYADFVAPWLAVSAGCAAGTLRSAAAARPRVRRAMVAAVTAAVTGIAAFQARELYGLHARNIYAEQALIPAGACVISDEVSLPLAANRFTAGTGGCPEMLDSLATTLVDDGGISVQGGAKTQPRVVAAWQRIFSHARYVWLSSAFQRRIPWTRELRRWFQGNFRALRVPARRHPVGVVYQKR